MSKTKKPKKTTKPLTPKQLVGVRQCIDALDKGLQRLSDAITLRRAVPVTVSATITVHTRTTP
jgi:hypothetical protein